MARRPEQPVAPRSSDDDDGRLVGQSALAVRPRSAPGDVEHQVVTLPGQSEVVAHVIDDVVRAKRAHELDVPRAAHGGHFRSERLGNLDGKRADSAGRAVDQDPLSRLKPTLVAKPLKRGYRRHRYGRRLLE